MFVALLALAALAPALRDFDDWVVGCDNGRACQASAYAPKEGQGGATLTLVRSPAGDALPRIWLNPLTEERVTDIAVDGRPLGLRLTIAKDALLVAPQDSLRFARALRSGRRAQLLGVGGRNLGTIEVTGATAAMLFIDEQQRRLRTYGALVTEGSLPDASVPQAPSVPTIRAVGGSSRPAASLSPRALDTLIKREGCERGAAPTSEHITRHRLDDRHTLLEIVFLCHSGAYNIVSTLTVIPDKGAPQPAKFDVSPVFQENGGRLVYNAQWDPEQRRLTTGFKGRGIGDCGNLESYAWDGSRFRLVESSAMSDCRFVTDYIVTFRARVTER
nr:DUF1176 domain-containing protein [uncultured Sphingomonas sp.]